jgi:chromate transporter
VSTAHPLVSIALVFAPLSLLSFGGGQAVLPEIERQSVRVEHWLDDRAFADLFGLSRAAPGPSTLIVALIGWRAAGLAGAAVATLAMYVPSSLLTYFAGSLWRRAAPTRLGMAVENGLAPVAVGLTLAGPVVILRSAHAGVVQIATSVVVLALLSFTRVSPYVVALGTAATFAAFYGALGPAIL